MRVAMSYQASPANMSERRRYCIPSDRSISTIRAFSHIEGATIGPGSSIGPFARLRPGSGKTPL